MNRYLIIIARDRPDLLGTLAVLYGRKGAVDLVFDRRRGQPWTGPGDRPHRRHQPHRESVLQAYGYLVLPRQPSSSRRAELAESAAVDARCAFRPVRWDAVRRARVASAPDTWRDCL